MSKSNISIEVELDETRTPVAIEWDATVGTEKKQTAKAMILSLWDGADKAALRIDLWTQKMMVDEMADFYFQTLMTMADSFGRATKQMELVDDMKNFAKQFFSKFNDLQMQQNKLEQ